MKPSPLTPRDVISIIAPSSKCHPSVADKLKDFLALWDLQCDIPEQLFGESLLFANSDEIRFEQLKNALLNPSSKAIWCLLGGYGATRLIPRLQAIKPPSHSKIFIGFSDITALHIFLQQQWGWPTLHAPSGFQVALDKVATESTDLLKKILFDDKYPLSYQQIAPLNEAAKQVGHRDAPIIGGNLHLIQASLGTPWQICANNKIVFIEEINERAYRIDRALTQLTQAGIFDQAQAILFGDLIDSGEPDGRFLIQDTIQEFAQHCPLPVLQIKNIGHGPTNNPLPLGTPSTLSLGPQPSLKFK